MKVKLKSTAPVLKYNGKEYGPGDRVEMSKEDAVKIKHHLEEGVELFGQEPPKEKELDDPSRL